MSRGRDSDLHLLHAVMQGFARCRWSRRWIAGVCHFPAVRVAPHRPILQADTDRRAALTYWHSTCSFKREVEPRYSEPVTDQPIRLVIAEGRQIVLLGLERFLSSVGDFAVVATATDGQGSLAAVRAHRPDVAVLDIRLPGKSGLEVAGEILREGLPTRIVLVTETIDDRESLEAFRLGIHGVLLKEMGPRLLVHCIRKVHAGGRWVERESLRRAVENLLRAEALPRPASSPLTLAEVRVAGLLAQGTRNKEIAHRLGVSESTIKNHLHNIYVKLNLSSRGELALWYGRPNGSLPAAT